MATTYQSQQFKVLGIDNDCDSCECCGRTGLKLTVVLGRLDADRNVVDVVRFGRDCAARATRLRRTGASMEVLATEAQRQAAEAELRREHLVGEVRSVKPVVIEAVGCNGGSITLLGYANGVLSVVREWAKQRWPNKELVVRWAV